MDFSHAHHEVRHQLQSRSWFVLGTWHLVLDSIVIQGSIAVYGVQILIFTFMPWNGSIPQVGRQSELEQVFRNSINHNVPLSRQKRLPQQMRLSPIADIPLQKHKPSLCPRYYLSPSAGLTTSTSPKSSKSPSSAHLTSSFSSDHHTVTARKPSPMMENLPRQTFPTESGQSRPPWALLLTSFEVLKSS